MGRGSILETVLGALPKRGTAVRFRRGPRQTHGRFWVPFFGFPNK